jgi:hypothetical protein
VVAIVAIDLICESLSLGSVMEENMKELTTTLVS